MDCKENQDDSESILSDESEEESEIDEEETEKRREECLAGIKELETQFAKLKEELIQEKLALVEKKLMEIENETAKEYTIPYNALKANMENRLKIAELLKNYRIENVEHTYNCEKESVKQSIKEQSEFQIYTIRSRIENEIQEVEEQRRLLYLEMKKYENNDDLLSQQQQQQQQTANSSQTPLGKRKTTTTSKLNQNDETTTTNNNNKNKKQATVSNISTAPYIVYRLSDWDILEDLSIISKYLDKNNNNSNK